MRRMGYFQQIASQGHHPYGPLMLYFQVSFSVTSIKLDPARAGLSSRRQKSVDSLLIDCHFKKQIAVPVLVSSRGGPAEDCHQGLDGLAAAAAQRRAREQSGIRRIPPLFARFYVPPLAGAVPIFTRRSGPAHAAQGNAHGQGRPKRGRLVRNCSCMSDSSSACRDTPKVYDDAFGKSLQFMVQFLRCQWWGDRESFWLAVSSYKGVPKGKFTDGAVRKDICK